MWPDPLQAICDLVDKYNALVRMDASRALDFMGRQGRGNHDHCGVMGRIEIITGTLGLTGSPADRRWHGCFLKMRVDSCNYQQIT